MNTSHYYGNNNPYLNDVISVVIDSGASRHSTYDKNLFITYTKYNCKIGVANGMPLAAIGIGTIALTITHPDGSTIKHTDGSSSTLYLTDTLHVPGLCFHLYSMRGALMNDKHDIQITPEQFTITTPTNNIIRATPNPKHGLYTFYGVSAVPPIESALVLDDPPVPATTEIDILSPGDNNVPPSTDNPLSVTLITQTALDRALLWHKRLGHPNPQVLRILRRFDKQFQFPLTKACLDAHKACDACNRAKAQHLSYSTNTLPRATRPMELIHSDIWGPFSTPSIGGCRYFVSFIDDYTRFTFVYLMVNKSEIYSKYEKFKSEASNTFRDAHIAYLYYRTPDASPDATIQTLLSDNGAEYLRLGREISHRDRTRVLLTNPHSPNQNPVAERLIGVIVRHPHCVSCIQGCPGLISWVEQ